MNHPRIDIDCAAAPYNPLPVIEAAFAQVAKLRALSYAPIFILAGESHHNAVETLLPYAAAYKAGLLNGQAPDAHLQNLQFACERPHDLLKMEVKDFREYFPDRIKPTDGPSAQLAHILSEYGSAEAHDPSRYMFTAFAQNQVPLHAVDASIKWGRVLPFLNAKDKLTQQFMPTEKPTHHMGFMAGEPCAMLARNRLMAHLLHQNGGHANALTWLNCGSKHLADEHSGQSLPTLLQGHVITIVQANDAYAGQTFPGPVIAYSNASSAEDDAQSTKKVLQHLRPL